MKSNVIRENKKDTIKYTRELAKEKDNKKVDEVEDRETKKVLE